MPDRGRGVLCGGDDGRQAACRRRGEPGLLKYPRCEGDVEDREVLAEHCLQARQRLKLHDLRDTFGTYQMMNPENAPREVQEWLGHANLVTTSERYSQYRQLKDAPGRAAASFRPRLRMVGEGEQLVEPIIEKLAVAA
jgi:hypothetical protein